MTERGEDRDTLLMQRLERLPQRERDILDAISLLLSALTDPNTDPEPFTWLVRLDKAGLLERLGVPPR